MLQTPASGVVAADTAWMLVATAMVLLMTPALAFFYGGMVRAKNTLNTMMMSFAALGFVGLAWAVIGYSFAFGEMSGGFVGGLAHVFLRGVGTEARGTHSARALHVLPGHVRDHHRGADLRRHRRADALRALPRVHHALVRARLCVRWRTGSGAAAGSAASARWTSPAARSSTSTLPRRPRWCSRRRSARGRTTRARRSCRATCRTRCWGPAFSGSAGSGSMAAARSRATPTAALAFANTMFAPTATLAVWTVLDTRRTGQVTAIRRRDGDRRRASSPSRRRPASSSRCPPSRSARWRPSRATTPCSTGHARGSTTHSTSSRLTGSGGVTGALLTGVFAAEGVERAAGRSVVRQLCAALVSAGGGTGDDRVQRCRDLLLLKLIALVDAGPRDPRGTRAWAST